MFACDLHTHTLRSDGHVTPIESIDRAATAGIKVFAITDHDTILPVYYEAKTSDFSDTVQRKVKLEDYALQQGVELIRGIEISCDTENEDVHIIGLFCDWDDPAFLELEQFVRDSRAGGYKEMVCRLVEDGYDISWDDILEKTGIADDPEKICKKHIYEYFAVKGYVDSWKEGKKWIQTTSRYNIKREKPDPIQMIQMIHRTGGIAILAHPFLIREMPVYDEKTMSRWEYIDMLVDAGLDGIEGCYSYDKTSYHGSLTKEEIEILIRKRYEEKGLIISGGSDFHGDYKTGMENPRELGECGISYEYYCDNIKR